MNKSYPTVRNASENESAQPSKILNSWKEIASYTGRGVRTVQRYEVQFGFPIHRPAGTSRSSVLAFSDEVEAWLRQAPVRRPLPTTNVIQMPANTSVDLNGTVDSGVCPLCRGTGRASAEVTSLPKPAANSNPGISQSGRFLDRDRSNRRQSLSN